MKDVVAIILAAGRSRRMGQFKPLLPFGDSTAIDHCIDNLRRGGVESIVVVAGHRAADLQNHLQSASVVFAVNPEPDSEMSESVACGVSQIPSSAKAILITPVDHPAVPAAVVARIIESWQEGAGLVVPTWDGHGGHPVLVDTAFRKELLSLAPGSGLRGLFRSHPGQVTRLSVESSYIARDMDTWDDYVSLHKDVFGVPPRRPFDQTEPEQPLEP
ncbi:MAG TPA: nucleotidyltransferase family protein [Pyrinomonadaceae bacterium]|nr:nucleotidyltransferase family protein [Pyrinomonadaceae bacterium]